MSIRNLINRHCSVGSLHYLRPNVASDPIRRHMFVVPELEKYLMGPWGDVEDEVRGNQLRGDLEVFITGGIVSVYCGSRRKKPPRTFLSRTNQSTDEIFSFRSTNPKPQIRVLGAFSEPDHFIALGHEFRDDIDWDYEIELCKTKWRNLFTTYPRHSGVCPDEYITENVRNS